MANKSKIMDKIARNLSMLKVSYSRDVSGIIVENGSNDLVVSYVDADIQKPMGGIDDSVSPFLGMGIANPGYLQIKGSDVASATAVKVGELLDTLVAAKVFHVVSGFANSIKLEKVSTGAGASLSEIVEGNCDLIGLGQ